ncbi:hypothetical protein ONZ45_g7238 [Pleurotus djamor]|nr:hypothetical protein ONZ45_g7238 [Pleurotus djamor]
MDSATSRTSGNSSSYASPPPPLPTSSRYPPAASATYPIVTNGVPRIMTTPATPVKAGTSSTRSPPPKLDTIESEGTTWQPMAIVDEEGRLGGLSADSGYAEPPRHKSRSNGKEKEKERRRPASSSGHTNHGHSTRSSGPPKTHLTSRGTKHGSFDFERPGWSGVASGKASTMARSVSGGSTSGGSALTSRTGGSGVNQSRESVINGNGSGTRIPPVRRSTKDSRTNGREKHRNLPDGPLEPDHTGSSAHTTASSAAGLNSSFGRSSGRKVVGGIAKLLGGVGHGPFPFEPPVPSPTYSAGTNPSPASAEGFARQQQQRPRDGLAGDAVVEPHTESRTHRVGFGYRGNDRSNPPPRETTSLEGRTNAGHRSAAKGRSLDLGLGLSWAPSKVKEEALLPFGRSASVSRRGENGRFQRNVPAAGDSATDLSKAGRDIAEIFRTVLDEDSYAAFRNYVRRFDAKQIPLDGPTGILACVERLLSRTPNLDRAGKDRLLDSFMRIILQNA